MCYNAIVMIGFYGYTMYLTYLNAASAIAGIYFVFHNDMKLAVICLAASGVFDAFDGIVARTKKNRTDMEKNYGIQLDSLADVVSFGILPVIIGIHIGLDEWWHIAVMSVYILATLTRLAYFNVTETEMQKVGIKRTHYLGMPVTCAAIIIPVAYLIFDFFEYPEIYGGILLFMALAFLVKFKVPKARYDEAFVRFLYTTAFGRAILKVLVKGFISKLVGWFMDRSLSTMLIEGFIRREFIDMSEYMVVEYDSFNDFFTRQVKDGLRPFPDDENELAAPCDGKLSAYHITEDSLFYIKKSIYDIKGLLHDEELANEFMDGTCLIFRLTPDDYHRYSFFDDGEITAHKKIKGVLHTVRPIVHKRFKVYTANAREYTVLQTKHFGKVVYVEIGAMFVGRIHNHKTSGRTARGEEKGMFEFGGSTVILLFKKDAIMLDDIIMMNTAEDKETVVKLGLSIGKASLAADRNPAGGGQLTD